MDPHSSVDILEFRAGGLTPARVAAIRETSLRIRLDGRDMAMVQCTGLHPRFLAVGFLCACGLIRTAQDIARLEVVERDDGIDVQVELSGARDNRERPHRPGALGVTSGLGLSVRPDAAGLGPLPAPGRPFLEPGQVLGLARELQERSTLYRLTRGCHNASLCTAEAMLLFRPDIGRHNAIDTIVGQCIMEAIPLADKMILSTGRIASEIVLKAVRAGAPVLASTAVATDLAVRMARQHGLTLLGNAKDEALWVYNNAGHLDLGLNPGPFPG